ncbi:MAG TPA: hypothetical protein VHE61_07420 [Opitutaceae bacterium]|nr:hypothetical protein [Opitutaceae bacterium]
MKPNAPRDPWPTLAAAARQATDSRDDSAPYGFSTRVVAAAFAQPRRGGSLVERFAFRAVGVACLLAIASAAYNYHYSASTKTPVAEEQATTDDPLSVLLDA